MKKFLGLMMVVGVIGAWSGAFAANCIDCHKSMDRVAEKIRASGVKSGEELVDFLRNKSSKKALHRYVKDEEIKRAFSEVKDQTSNNSLKKGETLQVPKKKKIEGC
jgi:mono/diheme cytochrome c family protein